VIRDYAQRGIVSRAERQGKGAIYGHRQLLEIVAARLLVAEGWPLAKIAEHFAHIADSGLRNLIYGHVARNGTLGRGRRPREREALRREATQSDDEHLDAMPQLWLESRYLSTSEEPSPDEFGERAAALRRAAAVMEEALRRLNLPGDVPAVEHLTLLPVAPWCRVLVESHRLSRLTVEDAEEIGRAVTAGLLLAAHERS
jgi:hypothetical protein